MDNPVPELGWLLLLVGGGLLLGGIFVWGVARYRNWQKRRPGRIKPTD